MPTTSQRHALAKAIQAAILAHDAFDDVRVVVGWPGDVREGAAGAGESDDLTLPVVGILPGNATDERARRPDYRETDNGDGTITALHALADVVYPVTIELWSATLTTHGGLEGALDDLLDGPSPADLSLGEPGPPGLPLTLTLYHGVTCRLRRLSSERLDAGGLATGHRRTTWDCEALVTRVKATTYTKRDTITIDLTVGEDVEV